MARAETILYHGTDSNNADSIREFGLFGTSGRIGSGVYFTTTKQHAHKIAEHRSQNGRRPFIITCRVITGHQYDFDMGSTKPRKALPRSKNWSQNGFQSATSMHPPWAGISEPFREVCVERTDAVRMISVEEIISDRKLGCLGNPLSGLHQPTLPLSLDAGGSSGGAPGPASTSGLTGEEASSASSSSSAPSTFSPAAPSPEDAPTPRSVHGTCSVVAGADDHYDVGGEEAADGGSVMARSQHEDSISELPVEEQDDEASIESQEDETDFVSRYVLVSSANSKDRPKLQEQVTEKERSSDALPPVELEKEQQMQQEQGALAPSEEPATTQEALTQPSAGSGGHDSRGGGDGKDDDAGSVASASIRTHEDEAEFAARYTVEEEDEDKEKPKDEQGEIAADAFCGNAACSIGGNRFCVSACRSCPDTVGTRTQGSSYFYLENAVAGLVLDVKKGKSHEKNGLWMFPKNGTPAQMWRLTRDGYLENAISGLVLDVRSGKAHEKNGVWMYKKNGTPAQKWKLTREGYLENSIAGLVLDVQGANPHEKAEVWMYNKNGTAAQKWRFVPM